MDRMQLTEKTVSYIGFTVVGLLVGVMLMIPMSSNPFYKVTVAENLCEGKFQNVWITVTRANGSVEQIEFHNLVVTGGKTRARDLLLGSAVNPANATIYISMSDDASPSAEWTKLPNEITNGSFVRSAGAYSTLNATAYQSVKIFTAVGNVTVQCVGLNWDPTSNSDNNLFAVAVFNQTALNKNDRIQIAWVINLVSSPTGT